VLLPLPQAGLLPSWQLPLRVLLLQLPGGEPQQPVAAQRALDPQQLRLPAAHEQLRAPLALAQQCRWKPRALQLGVALLLLLLPGGVRLLCLQLAAAHRVWPLGLAAAPLLPGWRQDRAVGRLALGPQAEWRQTVLQLRL
jgi:hypothetical protein